MPLRRQVRTPLALVAILLLGLAHGEATYTIGLDQSANAVLTAEATHVYRLDVPAGIVGFAVELHGEGRDVDLAVYFGDEELQYDDRSEPNRVFAVANPRAGTYRIVVTNLLADDLGYVLNVVTDGVEGVAPAMAPIGHEPCETDGACRAP